MAKKFLSTLLLMFISLCYFIYNARRDAAAEKEFDLVIQMTLEHILVQRFKKKETDEKCYKACKFLQKNYLAKSLFRHVKTFERFSLKSLNIGGVFRTQSNISDDILFRK